jgi:hypothetical protein
MKSVFLLTVIAIVVFPFCILHTLEGPTQPEAMQFEPVDATDLVNLATGDFTYTLPLMEVPGPEMGYPLVLSYHAGIGVNQEPTWVGLGWSLNPGAINRSISGYPDDYKGAKVQTHYEGESEVVSEVNLTVGYGSVGINMSFDSNGGMNGGIIIDLASKETGGVGPNFSIGSQGVGFGYGFKGGYGVNASLGNNGNFSISGGYNIASNLSAKIGIGWAKGRKGATLYGGLKARVSYKGFSTNVSLVGFSISTSGGNASFSGAAVGFSTSAMMDGTGYVSSFGFTIPIVTPWLFWGSFSYHEQQWHLEENYSEDSYGYIYQYDYHEAFNDRSALGAKYERQLQDKYIYPSQDNYSVNAQGLSGHFKPFVSEAFILVDEDDVEDKAILKNELLDSDDNPIIGPYTQQNDEIFRFLGDPGSNFITNDDIDDWGINYQNILLERQYSKKIIAHFSENGYGKITGFTITETDGTIYEYFKSVDNLFQYSASVNREDETEIRSNNSLGTPYATNWLLTAVKGPDYFDADENSECSDDDWGYWVKFYYKDTSSLHTWRAPYQGYGPASASENMKNYSVGIKELTFLDKVETASHIAKFEKNLSKNRYTAEFDNIMLPSYEQNVVFSNPGTGHYIQGDWEDDIAAVSATTDILKCYPKYEGPVYYSEYHLIPAYDMEPEDLQLTIPEHTVENVDIPNHNVNIELGPHNHTGDTQSVTIPAHNYNLNVPAHTYTMVIDGIPRTVHIPSSNQTVLIPERNNVSINIPSHIENNCDVGHDMDIFVHYYFDMDITVDQDFGTYQVDGVQRPAHNVTDFINSDKYYHESFNIQKNDLICSPQPNSSTLLEECDTHYWNSQVINSLCHISRVHHDQFSPAHEDFWDNIDITYQFHSLESFLILENVFDGSTQNITQKLNRIDLYLKSQLEDPANPGSGADDTPIQSVEFDYDYSLCPGTPNSSATASDGAVQGKLALKKVHFLGQKDEDGNDTPVMPPCIFEYAKGDAPGTGLNPEYHEHDWDRWGSYRDPDEGYDRGLYTHLTPQDETRANMASAWSLTNIISPTGGTINIDYESDSYSLVEDKDDFMYSNSILLNPGDNFSYGVTNSIQLSEIPEEIYIGEKIYIKTHKQDVEEVDGNPISVTDYYYLEGIQITSIQDNYLYFEPSFEFEEDDEWGGGGYGYTITYRYTLLYTPIDIYGGGIRVKSINLINGSEIYQTIYNYKDSHYMSSGCTASLPAQYKNKTLGFLDDFSNNNIYKKLYDRLYLDHELSFGRPAPGVIYSNVEMINVDCDDETINGKTVYEFYTAKDYTYEVNTTGDTLSINNKSGIYGKPKSVSHYEQYENNEETKFRKVNETQFNYAFSDELRGNGDDISPTSKVVDDDGNEYDYNTPLGLIQEKYAFQNDSCGDGLIKVDKRYQNVYNLGQKTIQYCYDEENNSDQPDGNFITQTVDFILEALTGQVLSSALFDSKEKARITKIEPAYWHYGKDLMKIQRIC